MKRKIALVIVAILVAATLCGFASHKLYEYRKSDFYYIVDKETGVNYVVFWNSSVVGCPSGICPRYNKDGSLYVSNPKK